MTPLHGRFALDATTKLQLQLHLINSYHLAKDPCVQPAPLELGTFEQLRLATKIFKLTTVTKASVVKWFDRNHSLFSLLNPLLLKQDAFVACVDRNRTTKVTAIYSLQQMHAIEESHQKSANLHALTWCILKIPPQLKAYLLETVHLEEGLIVTTQRAVEEKNAHTLARL